MRSVPTPPLNFVEELLVAFLSEDVGIQLIEMVLDEFFVFDIGQLYEDS